MAHPRKSSNLGTIGILSAIPEEIETLIQELKPSNGGSGKASSRESGRRRYHHGLLFGRPVVLVFSRIGKVAAATTATHLILEHDVTEILFTGVAGSADPQFGIGDIVVADLLYQHDMDASPLFPRHEIPLLGRQAIHATPDHRDRLLAAAQRFLARDLDRYVPPAIQREFHIRRPKAAAATIASGDKFFNKQADKDELKRRLTDVCAIEMEGAAVAQVCYEYGIPFSVIRTISDTADESAPVDFTRFIKFIASAYAKGILHALLTQPERQTAKAQSKSRPKANG
ncbi:MAG TPA: 5'-methylthioadenosine/adenosylhomocysteine nucleosidase [Planctomycetota bacterium]|nr:5'-methylthioadenosine/adenosylhomocysteine nucleosidase [Planctomycetota bacterium]